MKRIILVAIIAMLTLSIKAQTSTGINNKSAVDTSMVTNKLNFSIGFDEGVPVGPIAKQSSFALGGSLQVEYLILKDLGVTLNAGYLYFVAKSGKKGLSYVPVMGGLRYYFMPKIYLSGQLGTSYNIEDENDENFSFTYAQGIGFQLSRQMDVLLKYEGVNATAPKNYSFVGGRIAYKFGKSKK